MMLTIRRVRSHYRRTRNRKPKANTCSGKGTPRRKVKRAPARSGADDKKLQQTLKKLNTQPIQAIEEVNMFKSDGNVIHFSAPKGAYHSSLRRFRG